MIIRPVLPSEFHAWERLVLAYNPNVGPMTRNTFRGYFGAAPRTGCIVAANASGPVGLLIYTMQKQQFFQRPVCYIDGLYVDPKFRGQGIARRLMKYMTDWARSEGWERLHWVTENDNPARKLYDNLAGESGFVRYHLDF